MPRVVFFRRRKGNERTRAPRRQIRSDSVRPTPVPVFILFFPPWILVLIFFFDFYVLCLV
jgi:hypothetical protein